MNSTELIEKAQAAAQYRKLTDECIIGEVGAALLTSKGNLYTGLSISAASGIGFCAEHSAIAQMLAAGETRIQKAVAVSADGKIMPPCGRCREFFYQIDRGNLLTEIILQEERAVPLAELLPERWQELW
jgi:cytidine deaminase